MLNTYVQVDEVIQVVEPVNIFQREAFEKEVEKMLSPRAKADAIANRTKKTISEKMEEDPFFYRKLSTLLQQAIDDYKAERINEADYLAKVTGIMEEVRGGNGKNFPEVLKQNDLSRALFGALKEQMTEGAADGAGESASSAHEVGSTYGGPPSRFAPPTDEVLAEAALSMDKIIHKHAVVRWRDNQDAQNRMRNDLDDFLFDFKSQKGVVLNFDRMDGIIEAAIRIALHRTGDV